MSHSCGHSEGLRDACGPQRANTAYPLRTLGRQDPGQVNGQVLRPQILMKIPSGMAVCGVTWRAAATPSGRLQPFQGVRNPFRVLPTHYPGNSVPVSSRAVPIWLNTSINSFCKMSSSVSVGLCSPPAVHATILQQHLQRKNRGVS